MKTILFLIISTFIAANCYSQNKGFFPDGCSYQIISEPSRTTKNAQLVYADNFRFPFLLSDGEMIMLSNNEVKEPIAFSLPKEIKDCEDVFILDSLLICKYGTDIKSFNGEVIDEILIMEDEQYRIYPANEGYFYVVENASNSSSVYMIQTSTGDLNKLFDAPFPIDNIAGIGSKSYVSSNELIYTITEEECTLAEVTDSKVQSIDFYSDGAFYSTEKACYYMGAPGKSYPFLLGDIKKVMLVDNRLYLLFKNGLLSVIDNANQYQNYLDEVMDEVNKIKEKYKSN